MDISSLSFNGQTGILVDGHCRNLHHTAGSYNPSLLVLGLNRIILSVNFVLVGGDELFFFFVYLFRKHFYKRRFYLEKLLF